MDYWRKEYTFFALLAAISVSGYLLASLLTYRIGFPLDDAWIHQTYARNLVQYREWAFVPGKPSAGSTAPLWSGLLTMGHFLNLGPYIWTYLVGWLVLWAVGMTGYLGFLRLKPGKPGWAFVTGGLLVVEWHLVWSATSGMETLLFAFLVLMVLVWLLSGLKSHWAWVGLGALIGLSVWVRPDGVTLLGPASLVLLLIEKPWPHRLRIAIATLSAFSAIFAPYLILNYLLSGAWWPNTFYAKQAEYAILQQFPLWQRLLKLSILPLVGVGAVLLPGLLIYTLRAIRIRKWAAMAGVLWMLGYIALYAWRLPVTYQHGRYLIPMMPGFFLLGMVGVAEWVQLRSLDLFRRVLSGVWTITVGLVVIIFWGLGARAYGEDVAIIESEMVATARWVSANTPKETLIAAHDIGAIGYFGKRQLLDLAGLVSPEVIPILRDERALKGYLDTRQADYLVTFPGWYPYLVSRATLIFQTKENFSLSQGGENMAVYHWGED